RQERSQGARTGGSHARSGRRRKPNPAGEPVYGEGPARLGHDPDGPYGPGGDLRSPAYVSAAQSARAPGLQIPRTAGIAVMQPVERKLAWPRAPGAGENTIQVGRGGVPLWPPPVSGRPFDRAISIDSGGCQAGAPAPNSGAITRILNLFNVFFCRHL